jgi:hypothetical protein
MSRVEIVLLARSFSRLIIRVEFYTAIHENQEKKV